LPRKTSIGRGPQDDQRFPAFCARQRYGAAILAGFVALIYLFASDALTGPPVHASADIKKQAANGVPVVDPDAVCADCHRKIYESYKQTPMARDSGAAEDGLLQGSYFHAASGVHYSVFLRDGKAWMSYDRDSGVGTGNGQAALHGERQLLAYLGSGNLGRAYLYQINGQWFETPINYYTQKREWEMAPNYEGVKNMPAALTIDSNCLHCHATDVQQALPGARNRYDGPPFRQAGIGCAACHGDPSQHLAEMGAGPIVNPAKLDPVRRDSVCMQCHLEGVVAVYRPGTSLARFRAGDDLANYVTYFVKAGADTGGRRAVSQYEALLQSACKVASGDRLTCTTCHDPHSAPTPEERVRYYRSKCLSCHTGVVMATKHHPEQQDCAVCHMPSRPTTDISHEEVTDHNIQRYPATATQLRLTDMENTVELEPVGNVRAGDREYGLAYAQLAQQGDRVAGKKALDLLQKAEKEGADDYEMHTQLGFLEQMAGDGTSAVKEYDDAVRENPYDTAALGNLAVLKAASGHADEAISLLQRVIDADPSRTAAGLNLAFIECRIGDKKKALEIVTGLSRINPDDPAIRTFLTAGTYGGERCDLP
jgi:predicted CXXCH cytochrome family protein